MLTKVGSVFRSMSAFEVEKAPPSLPIRRMLDEPLTKASACWSTCTDVPARAVIAAREVGERRTGARRKPDVVGVDEQAVGVVRIDREALVVPVLRVVEAAAAERRALRAGHERPRGAAVRARPDAELAAGAAAAIAARVSGDGLHLRVDDVRVARRDRDVDPSELVGRYTVGPPIMRTVARLPLPAFMFAPVEYGLPVT